ncbi:hypothetical protein [Pigmentiphaga sp.]|uniref:hypothetical protein n=1 Tax=Pigmentiphaga sp. TaxID=1977564 RepID=UPI00341C24FB
MSTLRLSYWTLSPEAYQGLMATKKALEKSSLGKSLIDLVWLRILPGNACEGAARRRYAGGQAGCPGRLARKRPF